MDCVNKTAPVVDFPTPYKMIRTPNVKSGRVSTDGCKFVQKETFEKWTRRAEVKANDVLLTREAPLGEVGIVKSDEHLFLGQRLMQYRADPTVLDSDYLVYAFLSNDLQHQFKMHEGSGSVVSHIRVGDCSRFELNLPPLAVQKQIANILGALDKKIELSGQINTTLESMAQALFKSWFVDFDPVIDNALAAGNPIPELLHARAEARKALGDQRKPLPAAIQQQFPDRFVFAGEMGWVPEGWEPVSLDEIVDLIGGGTPKTSVEDYWGGDIPWFSVVDAPSSSDVFVFRTEKSISQLGLENSSTKLLPKGTTIISARGTVGKCALAGQPMTMNQSCYGVRGKTGIADYFVYYTILLRVSELQQRGHGSVFNTITRDTFKSIVTPRCPASLTAAFHDTIAPYFSRILESNQQSESLMRLRDTLLPKLLSGELRVPAAEAQIVEAL
ncbi:MAG: restriction endonuclease subunit S [Marinobacter sp.]